MSPFQWILIGVLGATLGANVFATTTRRLAPGTGVLFAILLVVGILAAIDPDRVTRVANAVGIQRGADLLLYLLVPATIAGFLAMYVRLRRVRREMTIVVRRLAQLEAEPGGRIGSEEVAGNDGHDASP
ncbi:MAG: DUF2304 domain-containing protein [Phycisphaerales bacterium]